MGMGYLVTLVTLTSLYVNPSLIDSAGGPKLREHQQGQEVEAD